MNILDVIRDCLVNPYFTKEYEIEKDTVSSTETNSITNKSAFSNYTTFTKSTNIDQRLLRIYMRVWSGLGKLISKTVTEGNCFVSLDLGYFFPSKIQGKFIYSPSIELIEKSGYGLCEDAYNVKPSNRNVNMKKVFASPSILAEYCYTDRETVVIISKELLIRVVSILYSI